MQVSSWIVIGAAELFTLLMLICIFLILHTKKLKGLIKGLQLKVQDLLTDLQQTKRAYAEMQDLLEEESEYPALLDAQIENTREYHLSLGPDQDISLDLDTDTPMPRQIASLRHAFLISEKEASLAGENKQPNWLVIQSKLATIMAFFKGGNSQSNGLQALEEDVDDLSDLQAALSEQQQETSALKHNISEAQKEAQEIHNGLTQINVQSSDQAEFDDLLQRYENIIVSLGGGDELAQLKTLTKEISTTVELSHSEGTPDNAELLQLRSLTADQHAMINKLQERLRSAQTADEKTMLFNDLSEQLERQKRFVQEAETCIELMDNELQEANGTIQQLQQQVKKLMADAGAGRQNEMAETIKDLQKNIDRLEQENEQLVMQLGM
jgi:chromosome segregation ATPase